MKSYCNKAECIFVNMGLFVEAITLQSTTRIAQSVWQQDYRLVN